MKEHQVTQEYFNGLAPQWEGEEVEACTTLNDLLSQLHLKETDTVLDIGCGTGVLFPLLARLTRPQTKIYAVDFAHRMTFAAARKSCRSIHIVCGCAQHFPFSDDTMDRIVAFHVFPHLHDKVQALQECWRVLNADGKLSIIHLHSSHEINALHARIGGAVEHHTLPSGARMKTLLKQVKFTVETSTDQPGRYCIVAKKVL